MARGRRTRSSSARASRSYARVGARLGSRTRPLFSNGTRYGKFLPIFHRSMRAGARGRSPPAEGAQDPSSRPGVLCTAGSVARALAVSRRMHVHTSVKNVRFFGTTRPHAKANTGERGRERAGTSARKSERERTRESEHRQARARPRRAKRRGPCDPLPMHMFARMRLRRLLRLLRQLRHRWPRRRQPYRPLRRRRCHQRTLPQRAPRLLP